MKEKNKKTGNKIDLMGKIRKLLKIDWKHCWHVYHAQHLDSDWMAPASHVPFINPKKQPHRQTTLADVYLSFSVEYLDVFVHLFFTVTFYLQCKK